jgi:hypothetical protein
MGRRLRTLASVSMIGMSAVPQFATLIHADDGLQTIVVTGTRPSASPCPVNATCLPGGQNYAGGGTGGSSSNYIPENEAFATGPTAASVLRQAKQIAEGIVYACPATGQSLESYRPQETRSCQSQVATALGALLAAAPNAPMVTCAAEPQSRIVLTWAGEFPCK